MESSTEWCRRSSSLNRTRSDGRQLGKGWGAEGNGEVHWRILNPDEDPVRLKHSSNALQYDTNMKNESQENMVFVQHHNRGPWPFSATW